MQLGGLQFTGHPAYLSAETVEEPPQAEKEQQDGTHSFPYNVL